MKSFNFHIKNTFLISSVASDFFNRVKMILLYLFLTIKNKLGSVSGFKKNKIIKLKYKGKVFFFNFSRRNDLFSLKEIFISNEYLFDLRVDPNIIFDLGANIGLSSIYFSVLYPNATIYAFEPNPYTFDILKLNVKEFQNIRIFNYAISDRDGTEKIYLNNQSVSSSFLKRGDSDSYVNVPVKNMDSIIKMLNIKNIDLLKFDIEGAENKVFSSFKGIGLVRSFIGEVHPDLVPIERENFKNLFCGFDLGIKELKKGRFVIRGERKI